MKWKKEELIDLLERTIGGQEIGDDWDDLGMCVNKSKDCFTRAWGSKVIAVEQLYPPRNPSELFNENGLAYLRELLSELRTIP